MYKNKKIGIIGGGNLGNNTWDLFARNNDVIVYDLIPEKNALLLVQFLMIY